MGDFITGLVPGDFVVTNFWAGPTIALQVLVELMAYSDKQRYKQFYV